MKQYTDITVLLDRSGSMQSIKSAMESAYQEFLITHKTVPSTRLTLIQFDSMNPQEVVYENTPVNDAGQLILIPRGTTPLLDALGRAVARTGARLKTIPDSDRPDSVLFVVITDGEENASYEFSPQRINDLITQQTNRYKWQFVYLGANQDAFKVGADMGFSTLNAMNYPASAAGVRSMSKSVSQASLNYVKRTDRAGAFAGFVPDGEDNS